MVVGNGKGGNTHFAQLVFKVKKTPFAEATGFWENQSQKIFKNLRIHFQNEEIELNDCKYLLYLQLTKTTLKFNEFNRRIQCL